MLDYLALQGSSENPTFVTILFTVLLAFLLSSLIAFTYEKTTRQVLTPADFLETLVLVAIVAATVMQAIGDSLARGLGMLGALAIIRFRTNLRNPRNMVFTFASLAAGIACGVYGYVIGITGTLGFCTVAFILRFSAMTKMSHFMGTLKFAIPIDSEQLKDIEVILKRYCYKHIQISYQLIQPKAKDPSDNPEKMITYEYNLKLKDSSEGPLLESALSNLESLRSLKINFENPPENV